MSSGREGGDGWGTPTSNQSSSNRSDRVVELIFDTANPNDPVGQWMIRPDFFMEDVLGANGDDDVEDRDDDNIIDNLSDSDGEEEAYGHFGNGYFNDADIDIIDYQDDHVDDVGNSDIEDDDEDDAEFDRDLDAFVLGLPVSDSEAESDNENIQNYDTNLPVVHQYLGENLEEARGRTILPEGCTTTLVLLNLDNHVIFPGQATPILTANLHPRLHSAFKWCIQNNTTTLGIMSNPRTCSIGTTVEIRNHSASEDNEDFKLIVEGRQRFKLISEPFERSTRGVVKILPELTLGSPSSYFRHTRLPISRQNYNPDMVVSKVPHWVLKKYDSMHMMQRLTEIITKQWMADSKQTDPNNFSYWLTANLPLDNERRNKALMMDCSEARLLWLIELLEKNNSLACVNCRNTVCGMADVFPMSRSGPQCSYVNPHGIIHDTLTVRKARGLRSMSRYTTEYSWFPGYEWRPTYCSQCAAHIGWCYKSDDENTSPRKFYGLTRTSITLSSQ